MNKDDEVVTVRVPCEPPVLNRESSRILLAILIELTEVPVLDGPRERGSNDC